MMHLKGNKNSQMAKHMSKAMGMPSGGKPGAQGNALARQLGMPSAMASAAARRPMDKPLPYIRGKSKASDSNKIKSVDDGSDSESDPDFADDADLDIEALREKRMESIKKQMNRQAEFKAKGHGEYQEVVEEDFLPAVTGSKYVVCHFYHRDFERCRIVDKHLKILAPAHLPTRFIHIDAEKTPFFVGKLKIRMLPSIVLFKDGVAIDRIVGFSELGGEDEFETIVLARRIAKAGVIVLPEQAKAGPDKSSVSIRNGMSSLSKDQDDSDSDWD